MFKLYISAADVTVQEKETITEGRAGLKCRMDFSPEWRDLVKTAVFEGAESRDVIVTTDTVTVPAECLTASGCSLKVGVCGKSTDGAVVIPTVYASLGRIARSARPSGLEPAEPTPDVVAQIQQAAANAEELARSVREDADLGKFNGAKGEGGWYAPRVTQPDESTMLVEFSPSIASMPSVPAKTITLPRGREGKSAYEQAVDSGFTGTEAEFAAKLAQEKFANPNALTFTGAVTGSYDGSEPVTVEIPSGGSGGGGISAFEKIGTIDLSTMAASNLCVDFTVTDVTEIVLIWTGMTNTTTSNSSLLLAFNSGDYYNTLGPRTGKAGSPSNGYTYLKVLENVGVLPIVSAGAISNTNYAQGGDPCSYNLIPVKEKIQKISIKQPSTQYYADAGIVEVYVR